jgi:hypothetical protein
MVVGSLPEAVQHSVERCSEVHPSEKSWADIPGALSVVGGILASKEQMSVLVEVLMLGPVGVRPRVVEEATFVYPRSV